MRTVLEAKNLCKTYIVNKRQNNVLKNVNLTVEEGEMVAVRYTGLPSMCRPLFRSSL